MQRGRKSGRIEAQGTGNVERKKSKKVRAIGGEMASREGEELRKEAEKIRNEKRIRKEGETENGPVEEE